MKYGLFSKRYSTFIKVIFVSIFPISFAHGADFKIDLSETISKEASAKIVDGAEKKKIALEYFRLRSLLHDLIASDKIIIPNIESTAYANGSLTIKFRLNFEKTELEKLYQILGEDPRVDGDKLVDLKSEIIKTDSKYVLEIDSNSNIHIPLPDVLLGEFSELVNNTYQIMLLSDSGEIIKSTNYGVSPVRLVKTKVVLTDNQEHTVKMELPAQEAAKIKSIKIKRIFFTDDTLLAGKLLKYKSLIKSNQSKLLLSSQSSEPMLAFDMAREKLLLSVSDVITMWSNLERNKNAYAAQTQVAYQFGLWFSQAAEIIALQSLAENEKSTKSYAFINDFVSIFSEENLNGIQTGRYRIKYRSDTEIGCQRYIPKDFKYDNPAKGFGFDGGNEVNAMMNQMGMANNSVVLGSPDQKTRVITGFISSLTENGGIISNGKTMNDANPIQFTKNGKTVVINPEKVTVGKSLIRIVGTYDQNSKIQLTNGLGGTKIVDAANINVSCIEGMQSSDEMMQNFYRTLGIMK